MVKIKAGISTDLSIAEVNAITCSPFGPGCRTKYAHIKIAGKNHSRLMK
jgi:hypothetical protein